MAFQSGTDRLACPDCGAPHDARWERIPVRDWQLLRCQNCHGVLVQGNSVKDYVSVTLAKDLP